MQDDQGSLTVHGVKDGQRRPAAAIERKRAVGIVEEGIAKLARVASQLGIDGRKRLPEFLLAYAVFRMSYCKMAADAEAGSTEEARLRHAYQIYRGVVEQLVIPRVRGYQQSGAGGLKRNASETNHLQSQ